MAFLVRFAVAALLPGTTGLPSAAELGLAAFVARFCRETSWTMWFVALGCAALFQVTPLITISVPLPAVLLPARWLDKHAAAMADHRIYLVRQAAFLLKMIGGLHWGADPGVRARFALAPYPPDPASWRRS